MKLSRTISYAVEATVALARCNSSTPIPCSQLAREGELPERFLLQVLRALVTGGVLRSAKGVDGGYCLARHPRQITLVHIIDAFENPTQFDVPPMPGLTADVRIRIQIALGQASQAAREVLSRLTIADLVEIV
jgi:Rrf2 family protein